MTKVIFETSHGNFSIEMYEAKAPTTVENFLNYVKSGFYNGIIFHRIIDGFMVQAGGYDSEWNYKESDSTIKNEADNMLSNEIGTIAMARTNDPHSASSQFFINVANNTFLNYQNKSNWGYCVFGKVVEGMEVVNKIKEVDTFVNPMTRMQDWPKDNVVIEKAFIAE